MSEVIVGLKTTAEDQDCFEAKGVAKVEGCGRIRASC
jgi:hypothetical protein